MAEWRSKRAGGFRTRARAGRAMFGQLHQQSPEFKKGELITSLTAEKLQKDAKDFADTALISDVSLITSFNWLGKTTNPTMLIPGEPPKWTPLAESRTLAVDSGQYFRDQNAARFPQHPMEPTALAILEARQVEPTDIDIVACGSTFGNLLRFARGLASPFRILVETVGETTFFIRRERSATETIEGVVGYGHAFPEANTTWSSDVKGSESHQRVVKYTFGGLQIVIRYEGDGYLASKGPDDRGSGTYMSLLEDFSDLKGLTSAFADETLAISSTATGSGALQIRQAGQLIPQENMIDIKTRSYRKKDQDTLGQEIPRFWVRQIPNFVLAHHNTGKFDHVDVRDIQMEVKNWEQEHQHELASFAALLQIVTDQVRKRRNKKLELCYAGGSRLEVREQLVDAGNVLSDAVRAQWLKGLTRIGGSSLDADGGVSLGTNAGVLGWDAGEELNYTACSEDCGYCGKCTY